MEIFERRIVVDSRDTFGDGGNSRYEAAVLRVLRAVGVFPTGRALFSSLRPGRVTVVPESRRQHHTCDVQRGGSGAAAGPGIIAGTHAMTFHARFTPAYYCNGGVWDARAILFHELFHLRDQRHRTPTPSAHYPNGEEMLAVTATNVLRSELGVELRKGYGGFADPAYETLCAAASPAPPTRPGQLRMRSRTRMLSSPATPCPDRPTPAHLRAFAAEFAESHRGTLTAFRDQEGGLFGRLRALPAPFNPFRAL